MGVILGGNFPRWELSGGNHPGGSFPITIKTAAERESRNSSSQGFSSSLSTARFSKPKIYLVTIFAINYLSI